LTLQVADRVQETTTTTGTGAFALGGAVTGYQAFSAVCSNNDTCFYCCFAGSQWEVGLGTYANSGNNLARTTVLASSNAGSAVNFVTGTKYLFMTYAAANAMLSERNLSDVGNAGTALSNIGGAPLASPTFTGTVTAPEFSASGLTGAIAGTRFVGATASGAPVTGTFSTGDFVIDQSGTMWVCTSGGTSGTWAQSGAGSYQTKLGIFNVKDYGAVGNGVALTSVAATNGSPIITASGHNFTSADIGKSISVGGAGVAATATITACTSANPTLITFTWSSNITGATPQPAEKIYITGATGVTALNGTRYLGGTITNTSGSTWTANLYSDSQTTLGINGAGTLGGSPVISVPMAWVAVIASINSTSSVNATVNCPGQTVTGQNGYVGTLDSTAVANALSAAVSSGSGTIYFPPGNYCIDVASPVLATSAIKIMNSNIGVLGSGRGMSNVVRMSDYGAIVGVGEYDLANNITDVTLRSISLQYGSTITQREGFITACVYCVGTASYSLSQITVEDIECSQSCLGINFLNNCTDSQVRGCYVHNTLADGISSYGVTTPNYRISVIGNSITGTGDDGISDNTYTGCSGPNHGMIIEGNTVLNSGATGIATRGSDQTVIQGNVVQNTFLANITGQAGFGFFTVKNTQIINNQCSGAGNATGGLIATGPPGGILIITDGSVNTTNLMITGNQVGSDLSTNAMGTPIAIYSTKGFNASSYVNVNHTISLNKINGPFLAVTGTYRNAVPNSNGAGIYVNSSSITSVLDNQIQQCYGEGITIGTLNTKSVIIRNNLIDQPNTINTGTYYGINIQGGQIIDVGDNLITGITNTIAGALNVAPQQTNTVTNTFSAGTFANNTALNGQTSTTGSLTWIAGPGSGGTVKTTTASPYFSNTITAGQTATALLPWGNRDVDITVTMPASGQPSGANQIFILLGNSNGSGAYIAVDCYNGNIGLLTYSNTTNVLTTSGVASSAAGIVISANDTLEVIMTQNLITVYWTHSGSRNTINQCFAPLTFNGGYHGIGFTTTNTVGIASFSIR